MPNQITGRGRNRELAVFLSVLTGRVARRCRCRRRRRRRHRDSAEESLIRFRSLSREYFQARVPDQTPDKGTLGSAWAFSGRRRLENTSQRAYPITPVKADFLKI